MRVDIVLLVITVTSSQAESRWRSAQCTTLTLGQTVLMLVVRRENSETE